jgi:16S rRNA (cytosine967-C5)-methyltransferase
VNKLIINSCVVVLDNYALDKGPADLQLSHFFKKNKKFGSNDRSNIAELFYGVIRNKRYLEALVGGTDFKKMVLIYLIKIKGKSVREILPYLSKNDENYLKNIKSKKKIINEWPIKLSLPDLIWKKLLKQYTQEQAISLAKSFLTPANLNLRVNTLKKKDIIEVLNELRSSFPDFSKNIVQNKLSPIGICLPRGTSIQKHQLFLNGNIEVQDEGSQILSFLVSPQRGQMVVDFCAGAGGKALAMSAMMKNTGRVYAFDVSEKRLANLKKRLKRSGASNIMPYRIKNENDIKIKRLRGKFDRVLVDSPCSGLGTLRRNPDIKWKHTEASLMELELKQQLIINSASQLCKIGGYLIYGTCSLLEEENENQVNKFLKKYPNFKLLPAAINLSKYQIRLSDKDYLKLDPYNNNTDGFFGALFERIK